MEVRDPFSITISNEVPYMSDNLVYSFKTKLYSPIQLQFKQWEIGLTTLMLPRSSEAYVAESLFAIVFRFQDRNPPGYPKTFEIVMSLKGDVYHTIEDMVMRIEKAISSQIMKFFEQNPDYYSIEEDRLPEFKYTMDITRKIYHFSEVELLCIPSNTPYKSYLKVLKGKDLWHVLGFESLELNHLYELPITTHHLASYAPITSSMVLYSPNLIEEQVFGDRPRPVLELVPYNINTEDPFNIINLRNPIYKRIRGGYISQIHIEIEDCDNKPVYFDKGKLQLVLHFRPCQQLTKL